VAARAFGMRLATPNRPAASNSPQPFKTQPFKPYVFKPHLFKPLSPETIKARRAKSIDAASMCPNEENLSQCNNKINRKLSSPSGAVTNPK
jgi:hypothetical protein